MLKVPMQEKLIQNKFSQVGKIQFPAGRPRDIYVRRIVILINSLKQPAGSRDSRKAFWRARCTSQACLSHLFLLILLTGVVDGVSHRHCTASFSILEGLFGVLYAYRRVCSSVCEMPILLAKADTNTEAAAVTIVPPTEMQPQI